MAFGAILVNGPIPRSPRFNLLTVAQLFDAVENDIAERWAQGINVWPFSPDVPGGQDPCNVGTLRTKGGGTSPSIPSFSAFTAYIAETCTLRGVMPDPQAYADRATAAFAGLEYWAVETQLMRGTYIPANPFITDLNCTILTGAAVSPSAGLELLEDAIAATGRQGVIHAQPSLVTAWAKQFQVFREGSALVTAVGTPVVSGAAYVGAKPIAAGALTGRQSWGFATGPIIYQRGGEIIQLPERVDQAVDRATNTIVYRAERDYVVGWDKQLQSAALIDRAL